MESFSNFCPTIIQLLCGYQLLSNYYPTIDTYNYLSRNGIIIQLSNYCMISFLRIGTMPTI